MITRTGTETIRTENRRFHRGIFRHPLTRRPTEGTHLQPLRKFAPGGAGSTRRIGVLLFSLGACQIGDVRIYVQEGVDCPPVPKVPEEIVQVLNVTDWDLYAGPLMYVEEIVNFDQLTVFPAQIEECGLTGGASTQNP